MGKEHTLTGQAIKGRGLDHRVTEGSGVGPTPVICDAKQNVGPPLDLVLPIGLGGLQADRSTVPSTHHGRQADESNEVDLHGVISGYRLSRLLSFRVRQAGDFKGKGAQPMCHNDQSLARRVCCEIDHGAGGQPPAQHIPSGAPVGGDKDP